MRFHNSFCRCHIRSLPWYCMISFATIPSHRSRRCVGRKGRVGLSWFWPWKTFDRESLSILREVFPCWNPNNLWIRSKCLSNISWSICWFWDFDALILRSKWIHRWQVWVVGCYPHHCWRMVTTSGFHSRFPRFSTRRLPPLRGNSSSVRVNYSNSFAAVSPPNYEALRPFTSIYWDHSYII